MDITTCVDLVIGVCMLVSVLVGYHRGFLVTIARIVAMVASYIGAVLAAGTLKKMLAQTVFMPVLEKQMGSGALAQLAGQALEPAAEGIAYSVAFLWCLRCYSLYCCIVSGHSSWWIIYRCLAP